MRSQKKAFFWKKCVLFASYLRPILHSERVFEVSPHQGAEKTTSKLRAFELTLETENFVPPCEEFPAFFAFSGLDETLSG